MTETYSLENRVKEFSKKLGVAQFGRAGSLGLSGRRFEPCHLDLNCPVVKLASRIILADKFEVRTLTGQPDIRPSEERQIATRKEENNR